MSLRDGEEDGLGVRAGEEAGVGNEGLGKYMRRRVRMREGRRGSDGNIEKVKRDTYTSREREDSGREGGVS